MEEEDDDIVRVDCLKKVLPHLLPVLVECCRFTKVDQIASLPSKDTELNIYTEKYYEDDEAADSVDFSEEDYSKLESI